MEQNENINPSEETQKSPESTVDAPDNLDNATLDATNAYTYQAGSASENTNEVTKLTAELAEMKDKYMRLYADFENFRRRSAKERLEVLKSASEDVLKSVLPVLDDFERAQKSLAAVDDVQMVREGITILNHKLMKALEHKGLKPMESVGKPFNPELHESITQTPAPTNDLKGKVVDEIERGYYLQDKVIRFAKVVVGA